MTDTTRAHIAVLSTNLFFAANYSLIKYVSPNYIGPYGLNVIRVAISILLFWFLWMFGKSEVGIKRKHIWRFVLCGLTGIAINQMMFMKGLTLTSTIHASLLMLCTPLLITIFAFWVLKEKITILKSAGLALGIGGALMLILGKEQSTTATNYVLGDTLIIINAFSYAAYFILVKPLMKEYNPVHVVRWVFMIGFLFLLPFGWNEMMNAKWDGFETSHYIALFFIVFTGTFLAYYFNIFGISKLGAAITGSYIYTQPVFAVLIAIVFLDEQLTFQKIIAAILIFAGVFLVNRKSNGTEN